MENELESHSEEYIYRNIRNVIFEKLIHLICKQSHQHLLIQLIDAWIKINKSEDSVENYEVGKSLLNEEEEESKIVGVLNLIVCFRNYAGDG